LSFISVTTEKEKQVQKCYMFPSNLDPFAGKKIPPKAEKKGEKS
jgi:hypothetical protein